MQNRVIAPEILCLYKRQYIGATLKFMSQIESVEQPAIIDFSNTTLITTTASIVLLATIQSIQLQKNNLGYFQFDCKRSPIYKTYFIKGRSLHCLKKGAKSLDLSLPFCLKQVSDFSRHKKTAQEHVNYLYRQVIDNNIGKNYLNSVEKFFKLLQMAVLEAVMNIKHHAYVDNQPQQLWWQALWYNVPKQEIIFLIYDRGVGIARSYSEFTTGSALKLSDKEAFLEAIQGGKSRFRGNGRGNGLFNMLSLARDNGHVSLLLYSGHSVLSITEQNDKPYYFDELNLTGTLFQWVFKLPFGDV